MTTSGLSSTRLARMRNVMAEHVARGVVPGVVTLVSRRGEVHVEAVGVQTLGGAPMQRDSLFRIASMTKPVATVGAMILVEACKLRLDEPVERLLPELADRRVLKRLDGPLEDTVPARRAITVRDLLTMGMGLGHILANSRDVPIQKRLNELNLLQGPPQPLSVPAPEVWMREVGTLPLMHQPGEGWMYDLSLDVLGVLIARAAGKPLDVFLRESVFEPLGMKDTGFSVPAEQMHRLVTCYAPGPRGALVVYDPAEGGQWSRPPAFPAAASGLVSTADDCLAFGEMLLNQGRHGRERILSRPAVELMTRDVLTPEQQASARLFVGEGGGWGLGMSVITRRTHLAWSVGSFGWDGGLGTSWRSDPVEGLVGILLTQSAWTSPRPPEVLLDFWTTAYQAIDD
ncbi:serine hydrolase domain-containing protein [Chondromyces crocatus]|uniref:Serine hydrolase n=1 Tax=Chondromyces crocatus TaxID=52 RepID=A0A0K1ESZ3_CHOCO|nr:serine hydrolase domain-containing protein [Chondromyces crocatus]AKT43762.1 serine hydrolase [Chondromyces crocatus]